MNLDTNVTCNSDYRVASLPNGGFAAAWTHDVTGESMDIKQLYGRVFDNSTMPVGLTGSVTKVGTGASNTMSGMMSTNSGMLPTPNSSPSTSLEVSSGASLSKRIVSLVQAIVLIVFSDIIGGE